MTNFTNWIWAILLSFGLVSFAGIFIIGLNQDYNTNYIFPIIDNTTQSNLLSYQDNAEDQLKSTEATFTQDNGLSVLAIFGLMKDIFSKIGQFLTGGWIINLGNLLNIGQTGIIIGKTIWQIALLSLTLFIISAFLRWRT